MNRKWVSKAISDIDEVFIAESMILPSAKADHAPGRTKNMENSSRAIFSRRITVLILTACFIFTLAVTAYAADIGGVRRIVQIWIHGEQTTAVLNIEDGQYTLTEEDGIPIMSGGGVAIEADGTERPVTEEEIVAHLNQPELMYKEDGTIWVFYRGNEIEITDKFDSEGICYLELRDGDAVLYATIKKGDGMAISPYSYVQPSEFGIGDG